MLLALFTLAVTAGAQPFRALNRTAAAFVSEVANGNLAEIAMGRVAIERSTRKDVAAYGEQLISDHQLLNDELKTLVIGTSFSFPRELTATHRAHVDAMRALPAKEFDAAFAAHLLKGPRGDDRDLRGPGARRRAQVSARLRKRSPAHARDAPSAREGAREARHVVTLTHHHPPSF